MFIYFILFYFWLQVNVVLVISLEKKRKRNPVQAHWKAIKWLGMLCSKCALVPKPSHLLRTLPAVGVPLLSYPESLFPGSFPFLYQHALTSFNKQINEARQLDSLPFQRLPTFSLSPLRVLLAFIAYFGSCQFPLTWPPPHPRWNSSCIVTGTFHAERELPPLPYSTSHPLLKDSPILALLTHHFRFFFCLTNPFF